MIERVLKFVVLVLGGRSCRRGWSAPLLFTMGVAMPMGLAVCMPVGMLGGMPIGMPGKPMETGARGRDTAKVRSTCSNIRISSEAIFGSSPLGTLNEAQGNLPHHDVLTRDDIHGWRSYEQYGSKVTWYF